MSEVLIQENLKRKPKSWGGYTFKRISGSWRCNKCEMFSEFPIAVSIPSYYNQRYMCVKCFQKRMRERSVKIKDMNDKVDFLLESLKFSDYELLHKLEAGQ